MKLFKTEFAPRPYQSVAVDGIASIFNKNPKDQRAFIVLPTATGKTWIAFFFLLKYYKNTNVKVIWTAHQINLVDQSKNSLISFLSKQNIEYKEELLKDGTSSIAFEGIELTFTTWQGLTIRKTKCDLLIIDEVHKGSSKTYSGNNQSDHSSFKTILKLSKAHLYISATPYNLNQELFPEFFYEGTKRDGKKIQVIVEDRRVIYTKKQAFADGSIVNTQMCCVQTVDTLQIKKMDIEQNFDDMEEGAEFIKETDIDIKNVKSREALSKSMRESMLEVFCQKEIKNGKIPQTMIFAKSKADATGMLTADNIRKEVIKIMKLVGKTLEFKLPTGKSLVRVVTSEQGDSDLDFEDFRNCKFPILIVVGMAKEGFDAPKTEVAIDFNFNVKNLRDMEQKIGRLLRISEGKYVARYYYPDIFENYLKVNNRKMQSNSEGKKDIEIAIESMNEGAVSSEILEAVESAVRTQALALDVGAMEEGEKDDKISLDAVEILNQIKPGGDRRMVVTSTSLVLDGAYNGNPLKNLYIKGLFDKVEEVEGQNEDYSTSQKLWEAFNRCVNG